MRFDFRELSVAELKDLLNTHERLRNYASPMDDGFTTDVVSVVKYAQKYTTNDMLPINPYAVVQELFFALADFLAESDEP